MHKRVRLLLCAAAAMCTISIQVQAEEESLHIDPGIIVDESEADGSEILEEPDNQEGVNLIEDNSEAAKDKEPLPPDAMPEDVISDSAASTASSSPMDVYAKSLVEYANADEKYLSDSMYIASTKHTTKTGGVYYITHVAIADASQINGERANGGWNKGRENPQDAAARLGSALLINGSYFKWSDSLPNGGDIYFDKSQVCGQYTNSATGYEICLKNDGTLFSPSPGMSAESLAAEGVRFSWGTCEDQLIKDGQKCELKDTGWDFQPYPRNAIGMVRPLEYYIITAGETGHSHGITVYMEQEIFTSLGCTYARGLDGGGSAALYMGTKRVNPYVENPVRSVADFLYFTETGMSKNTR